MTGEVWTPYPGIHHPSPAQFPYLFPPPFSPFFGGGGGGGGVFKNTCELLNLRALKFSYVNKIHIFQYMGKVPFEIPLKISCPYIERYDFYSTLKF